MTTNSNNKTVGMSIYFRLPNGNVSEERFTVTQEVQEKIAKDYSDYLNTQTKTKAVSYQVHNAKGNERLLTVDFSQVHFIC